MNQKVQVGVGGPVTTLTDNHYKASGGEAKIFVNGGTAYKIYHDPKKVMPLAKLTELARITTPRVVVPQQIILDTAGIPIGFTTVFVDNAVPLVKLFTRIFKQQNNITPKITAELVKLMQLTTQDVHKAQCLIGDFNELNVLTKIEPTAIYPFFIDVDSYATPSFRATAIMDSIRDRKASSQKNGHLAYNPTELSDWFSWGILTFWLYTNVHVFRGSHPNYKPADKSKQMDDGISVFHQGVRVPPTVSDWNAVIPKRHLDWYKDEFLNGNRSMPPLPDSISPVAVPAAIVIVKGTAQLAVIQYLSYPDPVINIHSYLGTLYASTKSASFTRDKQTMPNPHDKPMLLCTAADGSPVGASHWGTTVTFYDIRKNVAVGTAMGAGVFARNNCIYTVGNGKMSEHSFMTLGGKVIHQMKSIENVSALTSTVFDGCVIQDLLGRMYLTLPYGKGRSFSKYIAQLDGHRIIDAKSDKTVTVVVTEKGGKFHRFVIVFSNNFGTFDVRQVVDIAYDSINFAVSEGGLCLLLANPTELEIFTNNQSAQVINDPPFDSTMKLFTTPDGFFFVNGNTVHQLKKV